MNNPFNRLWSTAKASFAGNRNHMYRGMFRVGGAAAVGAGAGYAAGDHPFIGAGIGALGGAAGHMAMGGYSAKIHMMRAAANRGGHLRPWVQKTPWIF